MKSVHFVGTSRGDIRQLPDSAQETARTDLDLGKSRYIDLLKWRREEGL